MTSATHVETPVPAVARAARPGRSLAVLITGAAMMQAALMVASTAGTLSYAAAFGDRWAGIPGTAGVLGVAAGSVGLTWLMGRIGRRPGLIAAYAAGAAGAVLAIAGVLVEPLLTTGGLFLLGVGGAGSQLARYAGGELYPETRKGFAIGAVVWAGTIGAVGGPALLAASADAAGWFGLPPLAGAFLLAVAAAGVAGLVTTGLRRRTAPNPGQATTGRRLRLLASPATRVALAAMIVSQVIMVAIMIAAPLHMHHHGHGLAAVGIVISVHVLGMYVLAPLSGYLADRFGGARMLVAGLLLVGGSTAPLLSGAPMTGMGLPAVLFVLGYGWNLTLVGGSALLVREVPAADQLRVQGGVEACVWGASAFAAFSSTQLFAVGGYQILAAVSVALVALPLLYIARTRSIPDRPGR
jgi:MFS family permease